ncbi:MAG: sulfatase-like hydrolase/transferase [Candidatus Hydrogenedentes bacterium]|nr:sulfatase-like hydrolase/transferase [Candidatus Hydrogenedentota bacterium]
MTYTPAVSKSRPNILWLMTDEQRTDSLGCYGSPWARTPNLDRFAQAGVVFRHAVTPAPVCAPARVSILTGQYPHRTGVWWNVNNPNRTQPWLTEPFHRAGYRSATFGKQHYCASNPPFQTEVHFELTEKVTYFDYVRPYEAEGYGAIVYPRQPYGWILGGRFPGRADDTAEARAVRLAQEWLESHDLRQPFFLRVSFNAPHTPVVPPEPFDTVVREEAVRFPSETEHTPEHQPEWIAKSLAQRATASRLTPEQIRATRRYYYGQVAFVDHQCGVLLDWMRERELLQDTIVVFVSDHGTHLGDFGLVQKQTFYEPVVCVPFFFWYPKEFARGAMIETPVEMFSLLPTLLDAAGLERPARCDAASLLPALRSGREPRSRPVFSEFTLGSFNVRHDDRLVMVRDGNWKLSLCLDTYGGDGTLYDLADDPYEQRNLYNVDGYYKVQRKLTELIKRHIG